MDSIRLSRSSPPRGTWIVPTVVTLVTLASIATAIIGFGNVINYKVLDQWHISDILGKFDIKPDFSPLTNGTMTLAGSGVGTAGIIYLGYRSGVAIKDRLTRNTEDQYDVFFRGNNV